MAADSNQQPDRCIATNMQSDWTNYQDEQDKFDGGTSVDVMHGWMGG